LYRGGKIGEEDEEDEEEEPYDRKGPCHCWMSEKKREKEQAAKDVEKINELEPLMRDAWELESGMGRVSLSTKAKGLPGEEERKAGSKVERRSRLVPIPG